MVAIIIYQGVLIAHGTRVVQMLIGLSVLAGLFWASHVFQLHAVTWLLGHFFESSFIIAIILFQDQIRTALANFGTGKTLFRFLGRDSSHSLAEGLASSVMGLSRKKTGALVVLEKGQGLGNLKSTGILLEARFHPSLIASIFESKGPLHDGAVIISEDRIESAGCVLPLEEDAELDRHLGTRHRAALGVTRQTDCIAIVVSEENGKINLAADGMFYACSSVDELSGYIKHFLSHKKGPHS